MRTLVLGSSGWIGSPLVTRVGNFSNAPISSKTSRSEFNTWISLQNADTYINCIGKNSGTEADMEWSNIGVVESILNHAKKTGARVINLGSASEYGNAQVQEIDEEFHPNPTSTYGKQKLVANQMINDFVSQGGSGVATRIFNVVGARQSSSTAIGQIIARMRELKSGDEIEVANYDIVRDYISIDFVVEVISKLPTESFSGTLNIGSGRPVILSDLLQEIGILLEASVVSGNLDEDRISVAVASTKRLKGLGFSIENCTLQELALIATKN
jgi:nucleoside-diphosphate-sugar epimerase